RARPGGKSLLEEASFGKPVSTTVSTLPDGSSVITQTLSNVRFIASAHIPQGITRYVEVPCPPPRPGPSLDYYLGIIFSKSNLEMDADEVLRATGQKTFTSRDSHDPLGGGVIV